MAEFMLGVDIGTTSTKAVLFTPQGRVVAHHSVGYPLLRPTPDAAEQDPAQIFQAVVGAIRVCLAAQAGAGQRLLGVAFSAAMHSVIAMGPDNTPLTGSITWADNRAAGWAERIQRDWGGLAIYRRTGTPTHPMSPLAKMVWLRHEQPALFTQTARFIGIKEYVFFRLFGRYWVDHSIASATGLFNLFQLDWDDEALALAGVRRDQLSELVPTTHIVQGLAGDIAQQLGLRADTPFVIGANDGVLSNLGVDAIAPGDVAVTIGTSGAMRTVIHEPRTDPGGRTFCYALTEQHWAVGGPVNNGGVVFRWVRDELAGAESAQARVQNLDPYDELTRMAAQVPPGAEGLLFHPYLAGERAPLWNADLRASFFGLGLRHRKAHMIRAALEGVIFNLHGILPTLETLVGTDTRIKATGGFARSPLWRQMMADVFNREVVVPESFESSCLGAAVLGLYALGRIKSLNVVSEMVGATHRHSPIAAHVEIYQRLLPIFHAIPVQLAQQYAALARFQRDSGGPAV
ncbi:gluconokinase [Roseateles koreensis]|uniref:Gluconokinase n=1 Tax=Roseateles koreensis TaxID=2987526 RepID=A0ABT5KR72_9BURK|nr:gluconokinase [Roseateles koreensis]MDC8785414.1 gluconokinase [Roseateles koreensis]